MTYINNIRLTGRTKYKAPFVETPGPTPDPTEDPFFANVTLLLQPEETDTTITDKSSFNNNLTVIATSLTTTSEAQYGKAMDFRNLDFRRVVEVNSDTVMDFGTGDFTLETWVYPTVRDSDTNAYIIDTVGPKVAFFRNGLEIFADGSMAFGGGGSSFVGGGSTFVGTLDYPLNQWVHVAISRNSGVISIYIDGVFKSSTPFAFSLDLPSPIYIGGVRTGFGGSWNFGDLMNSIRITSGVGRYTTNFTPVTRFPTE